VILGNREKILLKPLAKLTKYLNDDLNESLYSGDRSEVVIKLKYSVVPRFWHLINEGFPEIRIRGRIGMITCPQCDNKSYALDEVIYYCDEE
jgi:hypothetical protein